MQKVYWGILIMSLSQHKKLSTVSCWRSIMTARQVVIEDGIRSWTLYEGALSGLELPKMSANTLQSVQSAKKKQSINISLMASWNRCLFYRMWHLLKRLAWTGLLDCLFPCEMAWSMTAYLQLYVMWPSTRCLFPYVKLLLQLNLQNCFLSTLSAILGRPGILWLIETPV